MPCHNRTGQLRQAKSTGEQGIRDSKYRYIDAFRGSFHLLSSYSIQLPEYESSPKISAISAGKYLNNTKRARNCSPDLLPHCLEQRNNKKYHTTTAKTY